MTNAGLRLFLAGVVFMSFCSLHLEAVQDSTDNQVSKRHNPGKQVAGFAGFHVALPNVAPSHISNVELDAPFRRKLVGL